MRPPSLDRAPARDEVGPVTLGTHIVVRDSVRTPALR